MSSEEAPTTIWTAYFKDILKHGRAKHYRIKTGLLPTNETELFDMAQDAADDALWYGLKDYELRMSKQKSVARYKSNLLVAFRVVNGEVEKAIWWASDDAQILLIRDETLFGDMDSASKQQRIRISTPRPKFESFPSDSGFVLSSYGFPKALLPKEKVELERSPRILSQGYGVALGKIEGHGLSEENVASKRVRKERPLY